MIEPNNEKISLCASYYNADEKLECLKITKVKYNFKCRHC